MNTTNEVLRSDFQTGTAPKPLALHLQFLFPTRHKYPIDSILFDPQCPFHATQDVLLVSLADFHGIDTSL